MDHSDSESEKESGQIPFIEIKGEEKSGVKCFDASKFLERSQSDAALAVHNICSQDIGPSTSMENVSKDKDVLNGTKVSETSKVYFDLSNLDEADITSTVVSKDVKVKFRLDQDLDTQKEESVVTYLSYSSPVSSPSVCLRCVETNTLHEQTEVQEEKIVAAFATTEEVPVCTFYTKYPLLVQQTHGQDSHQAWVLKTDNIKLRYQNYCYNLERSITALKRVSIDEEAVHLREILGILKDAWSFPVYGRDLAYCLCDIIRNEGILDLIVKNCDMECKETLMASISLLEQVMSTKNRETIAEDGLEKVVKMTYKNIGNCELAQETTGILENLFKVSNEVSAKVIEYGGLNVILYWCRSSNTKILRRCAKAFANLALFGGPENQEIMAARKVPEWLFPLAFMEDNLIRYYACLAIASLVSNKEIEASVIKSGTLDLVFPFITSVKPAEFAKSDYFHRQGRDENWLQKLKPLLCSRRKESQALAAFHFAMEAGIKAKQGKQEIFYNIGVIEPLKKVASSPCTMVSKLAAEALQLIGEEVPHKLSQQVPLWTTEDVAHWLTEVGFKEYAQRFVECQIDGDLLLQMEEEDLLESVEMKPRMTRKRFLRELINLKVTADYSSYDPTSIDPWLMGILPELSQYTYQMLRNGMDRELLGTATDEELKTECGIKNGIHRRIILQHLDDLSNTDQSLLLRRSMDLGASLSLSSHPRPVDVFISYRRSTGSQLASLLKVHLQLRGFSVFLDIDRLRAGKFDENLLLNIKMAKHFILVLTPSSLDRCIGDNDCLDWVHKEIVTALTAKCNIIPILDNCEWPEPEKLPEDMRPICFFNGIRWIHDYQDACVDKLECFLQGQSNAKQSRPTSPARHGQMVAHSMSQNTSHAIQSPK
ncbi:hypothetical protein CHS0354_007626 [Potamilus streckersoni]|uniref:ADP-ribosyl cyclase/cyclic ADP-ribose hydrolase n=1 Tax=Potamilus streckersoni TaxID=2493646 RepID=A0AAE0T4U9_9BIVA|nr:hypothetical protein CHS0354_007626 [Potamilus streckersoni]